MYQSTPQISTLKQQIFIIPGTLGQEYRHSLAGCLLLTLSHTARISVLTREAIATLNWGGAASKLTHVRGSQVFAGC